MEAEDSDVFGENDTFSDSCLKKPSNSRYRPSPKRLLPPLKPIDFEQHVRDHYRDKIKILNRLTFHQIEKPIVIFFNHFREKCAYHTKCLEKLHQLAMKFGESIEFLAGDMLDIDVLNPTKCAIDFFCKIGSPEKVTSIIYVLDKGKRVYEHESNDKSLETLMVLCETLLEEKLFRSQTPMGVNNSSLVKICVHDNYQELVMNSSKHILLVVNPEDYNELDMEYELNYEKLAQEFSSSNVDVVYINAEQNYVPHELGITKYPALLLLPYPNKAEFVDLIMDSYKEDNIIIKVKNYLKDPAAFLQQNRQELRKTSYQPLNISCDMQVEFQDLAKFLKDNYQHYLKAFERAAFLRSKRYIIIAFMDFGQNKCLAHHFKWLEQIYQVARNLNSPREYFIADFKDIDVINPQWNSQDFIKNSSKLSNTPKVFGIDLNLNKFVLKDFKTSASLYYFAYSLTNGELYITEPWPKINDGKLVKTCIADSLNLSITSAKKDVFLAIYYSQTKDEANEFLELLEQIAGEAKKFEVKCMKIDARLNCIPLELDNTMYPIFYYIPLTNKSKRILYVGDIVRKEELLDFISKNSQENKLEK